jgi:hypothetical protein
LVHTNWYERNLAKKKRDPPLLPGIQEPVESIPANLRRIKNYYMNSYTGSIATQDRVAEHTKKSGHRPRIKKHTISD